MIIKASRISTKSGGHAVINHVFYGPDNERIDVLIGTEFDVEDAFHDAGYQGCARAIRHVKLAPASVELTDEQALHAARQIAIEFQGDPESVIVVRHQKKRADLESEDTHFHILIPEFNHLTRKVMESSWSYARHEKLARQFEAEFGDTQVIGRFGKSVKKSLEKEGKHELAETIQIPDELPESAFTSTKHQILKAKGIDLARAKHIVSEIWNPEQSVSDFQKQLEAHGFQAVQGDKSWIVQTRDGTFIGSIDRLTKTKKGQVEAFFSKPEKPHIEQSIAMEKNHVRESENNSRNNEQQHNEITSVAGANERVRDEISTRVDVGSTSGINNNHREIGAESAKNYEALRNRFEEKIMNQSFARYSGMIKQIIKMAKGEGMTLVFNKNGLIMKTIGKRLSRIYNRANFLIEAIKKIKNEERRNKYIREAYNIADNIDFTKSDMVDYVLALKERDLKRGKALLNSLSNELDAHRESKPGIFLALVKRDLGWKKKLKTLEQKHSKLAARVEEVQVKFYKLKMDVEREADEIVSTFQSLSRTLKKTADIYRPKETVQEPVYAPSPTLNYRPRPEPEYRPESSFTL